MGNTPKELRELAESALRQLCDKIGVTYCRNTKTPGGWFLESVTYAQSNIAQWSDDPEKWSISYPLGNYGQNLRNAEIYDRCWFAHRCLTEKERMI